MRSLSAVTSTLSLGVAMVWARCFLSPSFEDEEELELVRSTKLVLGGRGEKDGDNLPECLDAGTWRVELGGEGSV